MEQIEHVLTDRGSKYAVSWGEAADRPAAEAFVKSLKRRKKFAKATHNTWAVLLPGEPVKNDDGESGAGMVILRMLERYGIEGVVVVVTRWYGGVHLGGDRFRHVQSCVQAFLEAREA